MSNDNATLPPDPRGTFRLMAIYPNSQRVIVETPADSCLSDMLDTLETYLIAVGFDPDQVRNALK